MPRAAGGRGRGDEEACPRRAAVAGFRGGRMEGDALRALQAVDAARYMLEARTLPTFGAKPLDRITPARVRKWFDAFSRTEPGNANNGLGVLRQIMNFAVACGHIETDPTRGIGRNRRPALTRFLSREEIDRLHEALDRHARDDRTRHQADMIRLLLLTGCRESEIVRLRWSEVRDNVLALAKAKMGPGRCRSTPGPGASTNASAEEKALTYSPLRAIRRGREGPITGFGIGSGERPASRMCACTTSGTLVQYSIST